MARRRSVLCALLALAVPVQAFALDGGGAETPPAEAAVLSVSASLGGCGLAETTIVCKIDSSWNSIEGAEYYTATITRADGSVVDYGQVGAGGVSVWIPYVGAGTYTIRISAYGTSPGEKEPELVARDAAATDDSIRREGTASATAGEDEQGFDGRGERPDGGQATVEEPPPVEPPPAPQCDEPDPPAEPEPSDEAGPEAGGDGDPTATLGSLPAPAVAALEDEAELPDSIACPPAG